MLECNRNQTKKGKTMKDTPKIIYYDDLLHDEFSTAVITPKRIDGNWNYIPTGPWKKFTHVFWYDIVAKPLAKAYLYTQFRHTIVGKEKIKPYMSHGFFLFGNHTQPTADALIPTMICSPKDVYVIVHPNNVSMPYLGRVTPSLGALPLPDDAAATKNFLHAVRTRVQAGNALCIYPEAHIWPYYTGIRPFVDTSFNFPIKENVPTFCFTNVYKKRHDGKGVQIVTYVDGPFFPDETLNRRDQRADLRNRVYNQMCERAKLNEVVVVDYRPRGEQP